MSWADSGTPGMGLATLTVALYTLSSCTTKGLRLRANPIQLRQSLQLHTGTVQSSIPISLLYDSDEHIISYLQDLNCLDCGTPVGLRCDSAPEGHILAT